MIRSRWTDDSALAVKYQAAIRRLRKGHEFALDLRGIIRPPSAIAAVLTALLLTPAAASAFTFSRTLCLGDAGTAVANLQQFLIDDGGRTLHRPARMLQ